MNVNTYEYRFCHGAQNIAMTRIDPKDIPDYKL